MSIDIGKAAFSGFALIGRRPLSVLVWGLVYLVLLGLPSIWVMSKFLPAYMEMIHGVVAAKAAGDTPAEAQQAAMQQMMGMMRIAPLFWLVGLFGLFVRGVLIAAVLRAVLEPDNKGFFYLRLGAQELWQTLLAFAMSFILGFLFAGVGIVSAILAGILAAILGKAAGVGVGLVMLLAFIACIYIVLRLSLAPAMTFGDKTFRLFESWTLTRGHAGALFGIVLILIALVLVFEAVVGGGVAAYVIANRENLRSFADSANAHSDPQAFVQNFFRTMQPIIIGAVAVASLFSGAILAIFLAPFATVYKHLTTGAATPAAT